MEPIRRVMAAVKSTGKIQRVKYVTRREQGDYVIKTKKGIFCTATYDPKAGIYVADDVYGVLVEGRY